MSSALTDSIPDWFSEAVACEPVRSSYVVTGASIELLTWGAVGKPGLLFLHGSAAHADWWSFIAPFFAKEFRIAAISWSGMGRSDWRKIYSLFTYVEELWAAIDTAGLNHSNVKPIIVAHSFGGLPALHAGLQYPERLRGMAFIDCRLRVRTLVQPGEHRQARVYPDAASILQRFRFVPPDTGEHPYIRDFIARHSIKPSIKPNIKQVAPPSDGWTWRFDPERRANMQYSGSEAAPAQLQVPAALIAGGSSTIVTAEQRELFRQTAPRMQQFLIPGAGHHVMVDQPLALIETLRTLFAFW